MTRTLLAMEARARGAPIQPPRKPDPTPSSSPPASGTRGRRWPQGVDRGEAHVTAALALGLSILLAMGPRPARAADDLTPYRALAGTPAGHAVLAAARAAIERYFDPSAPAPADSTVPDWPGAPTGLYLSLARGASTRACVGSAAPLAGTLAENLRRLASQVVAADPRRPPVRREELGELRLTVAFAGRGEPVADPMLVRPAAQGLLVTTPKGSLAFLPGEARTVSWALREARRAGVLERASEASFQRFSVVVLKEDLLPVEEDPHASH